MKENSYPRDNDSPSAPDNQAPRRPHIIGVTGGMASGKSTLAAMLAGPGIMHLDADKIVHHLLRQDQPTIAAIAHHFPSSVQQGAIMRGVLATHISQNPEALSVLESILHPRVRAVEEAAIRNAARHRLRAVILDIPLLFETDADQLCDLVIVAHAPLALRRRRAFARPGMTEEKWRRLLDRQLSDHTRHRAADNVIRTSLGKGAMRREVERLKHEWGLI